MTPTISGIIAVISTIVLLVSVTMPRKINVGDRFVHVNPGASDDPTMPPDPFVAIYTIEEIKDGKARRKWLVLHTDGRVQKYESWSSSSYGAFDKRF